MPKQMTREERAAYQRDYRARKKREAQEAGLIELRGGGPQQAQPTATSPVAPRPLTLAQRVAAGLAAPDDDCAACGHDRQAYHLPAELPCRGPAPYARGGVCRCPAFVDTSDPF